MSFASLITADYPQDFVKQMAETGKPRASTHRRVPARGLRPASYTVQPAPPRKLVEEGDVVDLGDRIFTVLHLPGHSPGSIGLWDAANGMLFSGDAIYDGPLYDFLPESNIADYVETMRRCSSCL